MKILITGHKGYIGSCLTKRLESKGHTIEGLDLKDGQDIRVIPIIGPYDLVIHLAGKSGVRESLTQPGEYWEQNVEGFRRILNLFAKTTRILYASSSSAAEPDLNPYGASKFCMERAAGRYKDTLGMRFHTVYNEQPREGMFIQKLLDGELKWINNHSRDFIHMEDLLDAIELLIGSKYIGTIDIGTGVAVPIPALVPEDFPVHLNSVGERLKTCADIKSLKKLGFKPKYDVIKFIKERV